PERPDSLFEDGTPVSLNFLRFAPPARLDRNPAGDVILPHVRLDRAMDYLLGDWLK
ncbi:MAG TPA: YcjX family protein, partial [Devosia sp.]